MRLTFVTGRSISGKTEKIYETVIRESIAHPDRQYILLVPEQASLMTQQALVDLHPNHALFNIDVLTFNRLSYRVFEDLKVSTKNVLSENGKLMLLKLIVSRHRDELVILKRNAHRIGFLNELKSVMSELSQYNVDEKTLREETEKVTDPLLKQKLQDICLLYGAYLALLHENYALSEEKLALLAEKIRDWAPAKDTVFVLEGYTGFTPPQYRVVDALIEKSAGVVLGITLGSGTTFSENREKDDLFYMSAAMKTAVEKLAEAHNVKAEELFVDGRGVSAEIRRIERDLFRYPKSAVPAEDAEEVAAHAHIHVYRTKDQQEEIAAVLAQILAAIREEEMLPDGRSVRKYHYNDIAVISGDPERFREEIEAQFSAAGIPFFIDSPKPLVNDPLFLLAKGLPALVKTDFRYHEVFSLVKNPIVVRWLERRLPDGRQRLLETENYVLARGIRGKSAYEKEWQGRYRHFQEERLPLINETKNILFSPFFTFADEMKAANTVREKLRAIRTCLHTLEAEAAMQALSESTCEETAAREYAGAPEYMQALFDEIEKILGDEILSDEEFNDVLLTGISGASLRLAPPTKDRLVIGDLMRTRLGNIRKLFVLGANEGLLPKISDGAGILTDRDREILGKQDLKLADTAKEETFFSHFYLYLLMTKPTESLTVFYASSGEDGSLMSPSFAVSELLAAFRGEEKDGEDVFDPTALRPEAFTDTEALLNTRTSVYRNIAQELRTYREQNAERKNTQETLKTLAGHYAWAFDDDEERTMRLFDALFYHYEQEKLDQAVAVGLYGKELKGSVSRLEDFASCPYKHFLDHGIRLEEQQIFRTDNRNIGTLFHDSVEAFFAVTKEEEKEWWALDDASRLEYVKKSVKRALENEETGVFQESARNRYMTAHVERVTDRSLKTLQHQWKSGNFDETEAEVPFESRRLRAFSLPLSDGVLLSLRGRIDRIDTAERDGKIYVRVIDYKTSKHKLDYTKVYYGLQLQLLLYLKAAEERAHAASAGKEIVPAGVYYYTLQDKPAEVPEDEKAAGFDPEQDILSHMLLDGVTNLAPEVLELTDPAFIDNAPAASTVAERLKTKKNGKLDKRSESGNMSGEELRGLAEYALSKAKALSEEMIRGDIAVRPADTKTTCKYCTYRQFCGFYSQVPGYHEKQMGSRVYQDLLRDSDSAVKDGSMPGSDMAAGTPDGGMTGKEESHG